MAFGTLGSTLNDELNRLANGGTYRDKSAMVDEALAAKQWANRENITPYSTDTVGVLNEIAGLGLDKKNWLDFNGVCNYLAGTTGLPAAAALRQITTTGDILTSLAVYYIDATDASASGQTITNLGTGGDLLPTTLGSSTAADSNDAKFLDFTGTNYVYLPGGGNNNMLTVPNSTELQNITGDIDLRLYIAADDWTPAAQQVLMYAVTTTANYKFIWYMNANGTLQLSWYPLGTLAGGITVTSTAAPVIADGAPLWIRVTLDVDNGAAGNDVKFWTSTNGTTWTQLGTTVTTAGVTSLFAAATTWRLISNNFPCKFYNAQVYSGIDGTLVLNAPASVITTGAATAFTALTGQTVTISRDTSGRKSVAVTQPTWLFGTDDYMEVNNRYMAHSGSNYLYLPGVASNFASTPDSAALDITGDLDLRLKLALDDWTPSALTYLFSKYQGAGNVSYAMSITTAGLLQLSWSVAGTTIISKTSTVAPTVTDGATLWVRATLDVDNGAVGNDVKFFTSTDGLTWTQLGATVTTALTTSIYAGTSVLEIGSVLNGTGNNARGKFFRAQVLNGIGGTVAFDANFETGITSNLPTTFTESSANAATVTVNYSGTAYRSAGVIASTYVYPGATNTFKLSTSSLLDFGATQDFTVVATIRSWATAGSSSRIISKEFASGGASYRIYNNSTLAGRATFDAADATNNTSTGGQAGAYTLGSTNTIVALRNTVGDFINLYNNSVAVGSNTTDITTGSLANPGSLAIGRNQQNSANYWDGEIYAVAVFRSVLTATQIRQISNYFANREVYL